eukprot:UN07757
MKRSIYKYCNILRKEFCGFTYKVYQRNRIVFRSHFNIKYNTLHLSKLLYAAPLVNMTTHNDKNDDTSHVEMKENHDPPTDNENNVKKKE